MNFKPLIISMLLLFLAGCHYKAPIDKGNKIKIDKSLLGRWEAIDPADGTPVKIVIVPFSETEYLIDYQEKSDVWYYRAYPIKIDTINYLQLVYIGDEFGPIKDSKGLYHVASYQIINSEMEFKLLNDGVVSQKIENTKALKKEFLKNKNHKELFKPHGKYKLIERQD